MKSRKPPPLCFLQALPMVLISAILIKREVSREDYFDMQPFSSCKIRSRANLKFSTYLTHARNLNMLLPRLKTTLHCAARIAKLQDDQHRVISFSTNAAGVFIHLLLPRLYVNVLSTAVIETFTEGCSSQSLRDLATRNPTRSN